MRGEVNHGMREATASVAAPRILATLELRFFYEPTDSRAPARSLRLLAQFRGPFAERRSRGKAAPDRLVRLRAGRVERRAVHDRAQRCRGFLRQKWRDDFRHSAQGAAGLGGVRERLLHSLFRL